MGIAYRHLKKERKEIRLLHLDAASRLEDPLQGTLHHVNLGPGVPYCALSYQWGQETEDKSTIGIKYEKSFTTKLLGSSSPRNAHSIGSSLSRALRHLRQKYGKIIIWTDALCINQIDETEKSWQVPLMNEVYSYAKEVYAWLGPLYNDEIALINSINAAFDLADSFWRLADRIDHKHGQLPENDWLALCVAVTSPYESTDPAQRSQTEFAERFRRAALADPSVRDSWKSVRDLSKIQYFSRMWILQEVGRATKLTFHWGLRHSPHRRIYLVLGLAYSLYESKNVPDTVQTQLTGFEARFMGSLFARVTCTQNASLRHVLVQAYFSAPPLHEAGDSRDLIYARLGLAVKSAVIKVDYNKLNVGDVFTDASRFLLQAGFVDLLAAFKPYRFQQGISREGVPSWVYDWTKKGPNSFGKCDASNGTSTQVTVTPYRNTNCKQALNISGLDIGRVETVKARFSTIVLDSGLDKMTIALGSLRAALEPLSEENKQLLIERLEYVYDQLGLQISEMEVESLFSYRSFPFASFWCWWIYWVGSLIEMIEEAESLQPNKISSTNVAELLFREEAEEVGNVATMRQFGTKEGLLALVNSQRQSKLILERDPEDDPEDSRALLIAESLFLSAWGMRPVVLSSGRLGYVPEETAAQDQVVIFRGVKAPLVIRKVTTDAYIIIGPAHICGAMQGQLMDGSSSTSVYKLV